MTKEEAIDLLDNLIGMVEDSQDNDYDEALKMGIEALERTSNAHPRHECVEPTHECVEMINREDAIIAVRKHRIDIDSPHKIVRKTYEDVIRDLPFELVGNSDTLRPKGKWIYSHDEMILICDQCGERFNIDDIDSALDFMDNAHFCINCGAEMRGEQNECN